MIVVLCSFSKASLGVKGLAKGFALSFGCFLLLPPFLFMSGKTQYEFDYFVVLLVSVYTWATCIIDITTT